MKLIISRFTAIIIILIVSLGVYANTLPNGFVYDDNQQVLENLWITNIRYLPNILFSSAWGFDIGHGASNYYRPMMHLIYMAEYHVFSLKPWGWHLVNILFHALNSIMVFLIVSMLINQSQIRNPKSEILNPALIAALLFDTHPINTEAVAWVGGIPELSFTLFYLMAFYLYMKHHPFLSVVSFFLATLSKETALMLPIFIIAYDYLKGERNRKTWLKYIPYGIAAIVYLILRLYALGGMSPRERIHPYLNTFQYLINIFPLFIQHLKSLILPINLAQFHVLNPVYSLLEIKAMSSIFLTLSISLIFYRLRRIDPLSLLIFLLIIFPILPVLYIPVLGRNPFAERYLYLPSIGFALILSLGIKQFASFCLTRKGIGIWFPTGIFVIILGIYSFGTVKRNFEWKDDYILWKTTIERYPNNYFALFQLGSVYLEKNLLDDAISTLEEAVKVNTHRTHPDPLILGHSSLKLADAYHKKGLLDEAIRVYIEVIKMAPNRVDANFNLGLIYYEKGLIDDAITSYQTALRFAKKPSDITDTYNNLGNAYARKGLLSEAMKHYEETLRIDPGNLVALHNIGIVRKMVQEGQSK